MKKKDARDVQIRNPKSEIRNPTASLICVGSELLRGKINTHASTLARKLQSVGVTLAHEETIPDELASLKAAIARSLERYSIVFVTGGLGPTFDDITREAAAAAVDRPLQFSKKQAALIRAKFRKAKYRKMPPANLRQAQVIAGAEILPNAHGTAPGQWIETANGSHEPKALTAAMSHEPEARSENYSHESEARSQNDSHEPEARSRNGSHESEARSHEQETNVGSVSRLMAHGSRLLVLLPGPPRELIPMVDSNVLPRLKKMIRSQPEAEAHLHFIGIPESQADQAIRPIISRSYRDGDARFTILAHLGLVDLDIFVNASTAQRAKARCEKLVAATLKKLGKYCYGRDGDYPLEKQVGDLLRKQKATLAVAESCTGGQLSSRLTDVAGSSAYFLGGVIAYHNRVKQEQLGVSQSLLEKDGAVSKSVARAMSHGVRQRYETTYGVSVTGIAGPSGATPTKPVGLVFIGIDGPRGSEVHEHLFTGARDAVRHRAVVWALEHLRRMLVKDNSR